MLCTPGVYLVSHLPVTLVLLETLVQLLDALSLLHNVFHLDAMYVTAFRPFSIVNQSTMLATTVSEQSAHVDQLNLLKLSQNPTATGPAQRDLHICA